MSCYFLFSSYHNTKLQLSDNNISTHTPLLVKRVNWGYLYTPIQTGTFECGYTPAYWGYTKYECDYIPITWGYPNTPSIGDMLLNAFIWHFRSHVGNAQMGTSPVGSVSTFPLAESDVCPRFTPFTNAHTHSVEILILSMKQIKSLSFFFFFLVVFLCTVPYKKETKRWGKIWVRIPPCANPLLCRNYLQAENSTSKP